MLLRARGMAKSRILSRREPSSMLTEDLAVLVAGFIFVVVSDLDDIDVFDGVLSFLKLFVM